MCEAGPPQTAGLIVIGFALQSLQYWVALLDVSVSAK
jgi:hypothetical protein